MATISDTLANQIQQAFDRYYLDTGNQNNFFFGAGDITLTKPDANASTVKVASYAKITAELAAHATTLGNYATTLGNHATTLGKVGRTDQTNVWTQGQTFTQEITVNRNVITKASLVGANIELFSPNPFIDFHLNSTTDDYTGRIILTDAHNLHVQGVNLYVDNSLTTNGSVAANSFVRGVGDVVSDNTHWPDTSNDKLIQGGTVRSRMVGRGPKGDPQGAWAGFYIEEYIGHEHRLVWYLDGFSASKAWTARSDGSFQSDTFYCNGLRTHFWTAIEGTYLEAYVDGKAKGFNFWDSDERLKEDIQAADTFRAADIVRQLRPVSFKYLDTENHSGKAYEFGVVAQEVEMIYPAMVQTHSDGLKALDPYAAVTLLLAHNHHLQNQIDAVAERLSELENAQKQPTEVV